MTATATPHERVSSPQIPVSVTGPLGIVMRTLGSMRLAVVLLVLLGLLTWLGTLAQTDRSLFDVQRDYFESWFVFAKMPLSVWGNTLGAITIPLPGAYPVMALLFVNLLVGGMLRVRWQKRNIGVLIGHLGIAMLLLAGLVKLHGSFSGSMALLEAPRNGEAPGDRVFQSSTFVSFHDFELALLTKGASTIEERLVPEAVLTGARGSDTVTLRAAGLPFSVQVSHWLDNCVAWPKGPMFLAATPVIDGVFLGAEPQSLQREQNVAGCYVTVIPDAGDRIESMLTSDDSDPRSSHRRPLTAFRRPFTFTVAGQVYGLDLRHVVYDLPFAVRLDEFRKNDHPGTTMASDFRSFVTVQDGGAARQVQIYMNTPLRKDGYVLYQASYGQAGTKANGEPEWYTALEVSNSPSDQWPKYSTFVIGIGLLLHFGSKLWKFLDSSTRKALQP